MKKSKVAIIGSGFAGLASAAILADKGYDVTIYEKNDQPGGRARIWEEAGFKFDMGPSWYWMPEVFEHFYQVFGKTTSDFYELERLDPSYRVFWGEKDFTDIPAEMSALEALFETIEPGSAVKLKEFLKQAEFKYKTGMGDYVFRPSHSIKEYIDLKLLVESFKIQMFTSVSKHLRQYFKHPKLLKLLEFPVLFLGGTAANTPALYSMMNYADLVLGTWFPKGGMNEIVKAMVAISTQKGVVIKLNHEVIKIRTEGNAASGIETLQGFFEADLTISNADYEHTDQVLVERNKRNYSPSIGISA
jgi:phytoene desaturase